MDKIPSLPTDSLYKFIAIFGLIIFLFGGYFFYESLDSDLKITINQVSEIKQKNNELKLYLVQLKMIEKRILDISKDINIGINCVVTDSIVECDYPQKNIKNTEQKILLNTQIDEFNRVKLLYLQKKYESFDLNSRTDSFKTLKWIIACLIIFPSEIIMLIGFILWHHRVQKPIDLESKNKKILDGKVFEVCQSCSKSIYDNNQRGKNNDGTTSFLYCKECFDNGVFIEPDLDFLIAYNRLSSNLKLSKNNILNKWKLKSDFNNLIRWRIKRHW
jgi:hypothetical protein